MIENKLILILIILIIILILAMILMMFLVFKTLLQKEKTHTEVISKLSQEKVSETFNCLNHPESMTAGTCLICEEAFCENCLIEHESLVFCKEHFHTFAQNSWSHISDVRTTPDSPEEALYVYHFKRFLWKELKKPSFVITHYKINIEHDFIESFVQLHVLQEEEENLKIQLNKKKGQD